MSEQVMVTVAEFAQIVKTDESTVRRAIQSGRIKAEKIGRGLKIEPLQGKIDWHANVNALQALRNRGGKKTLKENPTGDDTEFMSQSEAERREKVAKAKIAELKAGELEGTLVDAEKVKADAFSMGKKVKDNILNIPTRIAHELAAIVDPFEVEKMLNAELNKALEDLANE